MALLGAHDAGADVEGALLRPSGGRGAACEDRTVLRHGHVARDIALRAVRVDGQRLRSHPSSVRAVLLVVHLRRGNRRSVGVRRLGIAIAPEADYQDAEDGDEHGTDVVQRSTLHLWVVNHGLGRWLKRLRGRIRVLLRAVRTGVGERLQLVCRHRCRIFPCFVGHVGRLCCRRVVWHVLLLFCILNHRGDGLEMRVGFDLRDSGRLVELLRGICRGRCRCHLRGFRVRDGWVVEPARSQRDSRLPNPDASPDPWLGGLTEPHERTVHIVASLNGRHVLSSNRLVGHLQLLFRVRGSLYCNCKREQKNLTYIRFLVNIFNQ